MKNSILLQYGFMLIFTASCSNQPTVSPVSDQAADSKIAEQPEAPRLEAVLTESELKHTRLGKTLELVRVMEGGACKNSLQGLQVMFMLYADPGDVGRIKRERGNDVFAEFEQAIKQFSLQTLQDVADGMDFADDPFALDDEDSKQKLAEQFNELFRTAIAYPVAEFEKVTTLSIDLVPLPGSIYWYLNGCELPHAHD